MNLMFEVWTSSTICNFKYNLVFQIVLKYEHFVNYVLNNSITFSRNSDVLLYKAEISLEYNPYYNLRYFT